MTSKVTAVTFAEPNLTFLWQHWLTLRSSRLHIDWIQLKYQLIEFCISSEKLKTGSPNQAITAGLFAQRLSSCRCHYQCFLLFPSPRVFGDAGSHWGTVLILFGFRIVELQRLGTPCLCAFHRAPAIQNKESLEMQSKRTNLRASQPSIDSCCI